MLDEYFSMKINDRGLLESLPLLMGEYTPNLDLRFDIENLVPAWKPVPTSAVLADNDSRCSHLEEIELAPLADDNDPLRRP